MIGIERLGSLLPGAASHDRGVHEGRVDPGFTQGATPHPTPKKADVMQLGNGHTNTRTHAATTTTTKKKSNILTRTKRIVTFTHTLS